MRIWLVCALALMFGCDDGMLGGDASADTGDSSDASMDASADTGEEDTGTGTEDSGAGEDTGAEDTGMMSEDTGVDSAMEDTSPPMPEAFIEVDGLVAIEAEHYDDIEMGGPREWMLTTPDITPDARPDHDPNHSEGASGSAYLESLPDTRVTHDDPLMGGTNFWGRGGQGPELTYNVRFTNTGRYYIWMRAYSTGTEDNGAHVGIDGEYPGSGDRVQWCAGKNQWTWSSAQRDAGGSACGRPLSVWLQIDEPGMHTIHVSMREDGFEVDKFILTTDDSFTPDGVGPDERRE